MYNHFHIVLPVISRYSWLFMVIHVIKPTAPLAHSGSATGRLITSPASLSVSLTLSLHYCDQPDQASLRQSNML